MPLVTTIIARLLAIQDFVLAQMVDVSAVTKASPNGCWSFDVQNATLNVCGQALIGNETTGYRSLIDFFNNFTPNLISALIWTGPYGNWTPPNPGG